MEGVGGGGRGGGRGRRWRLEGEGMSKGGEPSFEGGEGEEDLF